MEDYSNQSQREILTVSEINQTANDFLNEAFPPLWVVGEISNFREYGTLVIGTFLLKIQSQFLVALCLDCKTMLLNSNQKKVIK